jgi:CheY-like chemotaxis protein
MTKSLPPKSLVLYADDDADDRELIKDAFEQYASIIELKTFEKGADLLHFLHQIAPLQPAPCLVILDINMPGLDGKQTLRRIRSMDNFQEVPVVLFTTSTLPAEAAFARAHNAGFVTKPLHNNQIQAILHQLTDHCTDEIKEKLRRNREI